MKTKLVKTLFVIALFFGSQVIHAESYQRWVYWIKPTHHQVTPEEMSEITSMLYDGEILPDEEFKLSTGVSLRIPQPKLYLRYIKKAVRTIKPSAETKEDIIKAISRAEKMRWGNDVSVLVKNYWVSDKLKTVVSTDNYSGENKDTDFLFIDGIPFIKCDCGNPLEAIDLIISDKEEKKSENRISNYTVKEEPAVTSFPKDLGQAVLNMKTEPKTYVGLPKVETSTWWDKNKGWVIPVGTGLVVAGTGFIAHDKYHQWYLWFPKTPVDAPPVGGDPQDGQPVDGKK